MLKLILRGLERVSGLVVEGKDLVVEGRGGCRRG